jgi:hypothetical protein
VERTSDLLLKNWTGLNRQNFGVSPTPERVGKGRVKTSKCAEKQIAFTLLQAQTVIRIEEIWRKFGILQATFCD